MLMKRDNGALPRGPQEDESIQVNLFWARLSSQIAGEIAGTGRAKGMLRLAATAGHGGEVTDKQCE
jgi:hypothetical protein